MGACTLVAMPPRETTPLPDPNLPERTSPVRMPRIAANRLPRHGEGVRDVLMHLCTASRGRAGSLLIHRPHLHRMHHAIGDPWRHALLPPRGVGLLARPRCSRRRLPTVGYWLPHSRSLHLCTWMGATVPLHARLPLSYP